LKLASTRDLNTSSIHCDELVSLSKSALTDFVATLSSVKMAELDRAVAIAVEILAEKS
jgi:mRNA interferase MazF